MKMCKQKLLSLAGWNKPSAYQDEKSSDIESDEHNPYNDLISPKHTL